MAKMHYPFTKDANNIYDERKAEIERIERKTFVYDDKRSTRNELDVYYPLNSTLTKDGKTPILFFVYGGGYNSGSKEFPEPFSMGYRALGSFFAQHEVKFPASSEDIRDAVNWIFTNVDVIAVPSIPAIWYFVDEKKRFRTEVPAQQYIGSQEKQREREPKALWNAPSDEQIKDHPDILLVRAEREPDWLLLSWEEILPDIEKRLGKAPQMIIGKGHNHISPNWALCSGQGEEWGEEVVEWMKARIN
ncbi:hypothetical protein EDB19DRAFT_1914779 [Suillus lakei]|nr:hypothetical protein EDB19DRAFT_1923655 [Suillus lakei]KAG1721349.1 hypothetical protein EDB19DRAFT_1962048 [Suillus lakei]KAG1726161.1 hypothetical protein EDB19DRAFT_1914779 [Suillus lakei]